MSSDVAIIGGGVIGLSIAREVALAGHSVAVHERGDFGREASWAGAGMLPPGNLEEASTPEARLRALSASLWKSLSDDLRETTGVDNGFRECGALEVFPASREDSISDDVYNWVSEGCSAQQLDSAGLQQYEPALTSELRGGYRLADFCQVRNPRHVKALLADCRRLDVTLAAGSVVTRLETAGRRVLKADSATGPIRADAFVIAAGAWTPHVIGSGLSPETVVPVRGQIALLSDHNRSLSHVIQEDKRYIVPRVDGRVLVGSTEENAGFEKVTTTRGIGSLLDFAARIVPALGDATLERTWAGLRPAGRKDVPYLCAVPERDNLYLASGHFRSGLQMSVASGRLMRQLILGEPTAIDLTPYSLNGDSATTPVAARGADR